ncbi:MAG: NAD-dependent epimerase/dehydratase family protein [Anaerolineae bacterium]|nr:NAD-dependent epimerase/dehydratase family protein [Anaerolineae bacterium]
MRIVIIGGTGNISTSVVRLLLGQGHDVTCYNRSGAAPDGARPMQGNRHDRPAYEAAMQAARFDAAIDMIGFSPEDAESNLRAFRGIGHFVHTSTVCVYGIQYDWLPASEDHPLRPITQYGRDKAAMDARYLRAFYEDGFPVTVLRPSTTHGPKQGLTRQVAWDFSWIDRIRKGKPIIVCGDGNALHQFLHVDDAAPAFAGVLGHAACFGQVYHLVARGYTTWAEYHRTAMRVIGREVDLIGVPFEDLRRLNVPDFGICEEIFAHHVYYSAEKLYRDVPAFNPQRTLEDAMRDILAAMDADGRVPNSDELTWEDRIIAAQRRVRA